MTERITEEDIREAMKESGGIDPDLESTNPAELMAGILLEKMLYL